MTGGGADSREEVAVRYGIGTVKMTPALVPTHNISRHTSIDVTRRQAALCCRMMSSQPTRKQAGLHYSMEKQNKEKCRYSRVRAEAMEIQIERNRILRRVFCVQALFDKRTPYALRFTMAAQQTTRTSSLAGCETGQTCARPERLKLPN